MKPKILIDSIALLSPLTGIGRYTYEIAKKLEKFNDVELTYYYGYYSKNLLKSEQPIHLRTIKAVISKNQLLKKIIRKIIVLLRKILTVNYDLYWQPNFIPIDGIKARKIVTSVHDFSFVLHRDFHPKERIRYFDKYFFENIIRSDIIITGSEYTKQEILKRLHVTEDKVKVIYHGINHHLFKVYEELKVDLELPSKFILSAGSIEPRKNLLGLLRAYHALHQNLKEEYQLVLVGFKGWENHEIMNIINNNTKHIHYLGYVNDVQLAKIYNLASLFVFPSFYEGFGLPPLEAMACGTPVVTSNLTSMPEVCADAAVYCNPYDIEDIKHKIELVLNDASLQKSMIYKGLERAKQFTWEKSANEHMKIFRKLITQ